ncbi:cupin domain-containing protein [Acinetobacter puyangensis]
MMKNWTFLHLFVDEMGISHVNHHATHELNATHFAPPAPPMLVSETIDTQSFIIIELPVGWQGGWHPSPNNQWVICLSGKMGYQAEDGTEFFLDAGSCILTTDTNGNGHNSWNAGSTPIQLAVIQLPAPD